MPIRLITVFSLLAAALTGPKAAAQVLNTIAGTFRDSIAATEVSLVPQTFTIDGKGNYYVADWHHSIVYRSGAGGRLYRLAGRGFNSYPQTTGPALKAGLSSPSGIAVDDTGNVYITDLGNTSIRKVDTAGIIRTIAGGIGNGFSGDGGPAISANLHNPGNLVIDSAGFIYFADRGNARIRRISPSGIISTVVGAGTYYSNTPTFSGDGGPATAAHIGLGASLAFDRAHNMYIADPANHRIRMVNTAGIISTVAGNGTAGFSGDGGAASSASLNGPTGVSVDSLGNIYIADLGNLRIRKVTPAGIISTVAGTGIRGFAGDGGPATAARLDRPISVLAKWGSVYICDMSNYRVRKIDAAGVISTVIGNGTGDSGQAYHAHVAVPTCIAPYGNTGLLISQVGAHVPGSSIRHIDPTGTIRNVAGNGTHGYSGDGGPATAAQLHYPSGIAVDTAGNIFISDFNNYCIRKVNRSGIITTIAGSPTYGFSGDGGPATAATMNNPAAVACDRSGNIYIADYYNNRVRKINAAGIISTIVGGFPPGYGGDGGPASAAMINGPYGVAADRRGNVYISELYGCRVRRIDTAGIISTFAGNGIKGYSGDGGQAGAAQLSGPRHLFADTIGNLLIADYFGNVVRRVDTAGIITTIAGLGLGGGIRGDSVSLDTAALGAPSAAAIDHEGNIVISEMGANRIRIVCAGTPAAATMSITVSPDSTILAGTPVTFTAHALHTAYSAGYEWKKVKLG